MLRIGSGVSCPQAREIPPAFHLCVASFRAPPAAWPNSLPTYRHDCPPPPVHRTPGRAVAVPNRARAYKPAAVAPRGSGALPSVRTFIDQRLREVAMIRYAFLSRLGSVAYVAVTYDENGCNLPSEIDGNKVEWSRIEGGEVFLLVSTADMERDTHEAGIHITETRTKRRPQISTSTRAR